MERVDRSPDDYLASVDGDIGATLRRVDATVAAAMPDRRRVLWHGTFWGGTEQTIVGYGHLVQPRPRGADVEWFIIGLARQKRHFSLYVNAVEADRYLGQEYADRLGKVKVGAANITFTRLDHLDLDVLDELCRHADRISPPD